jgi:hypothetical protein
MRVWELIEKLSKYDQNMPVKISAYESFITDAGTDLGDFIEKDIDDIYDLESRLVIRGEY